MRALIVTGLFMGCSSSPLSQYCASLASCNHAECELSAAACEELQQGEQDSCKAELGASRNVIAAGAAPECSACVEAMDRYYQCAADIPTCADFDDAATEDCDGEYEEYMGACTAQVLETCGQDGSIDTSSSAEKPHDTALRRDTGPTGTTGTTGSTGPTLIIDLVQTGCDDSGWFYYAETSAWTGDATANAWEVRDDGNGWNEEHSMPSVDFDPEDPSYDILERNLADDVAVGDFYPGVNTVFACGIHDQKDAEGMTYAVRVYDTDLNFADCAIWGSGVDAVFAGDSTVPAWNDVSNASEISADNCVIF